MGEEVRTWSLPASRVGPRPARGFPVPQVDVHGLTDIGRLHTTNRDQFLVADLDRWMLIRHGSARDGSRWSSGDQGKLLAVASGISGAGRAASMATIDSVAQYITSTMSWALSTSPEDDDRTTAERVVEELCYVLPRCQLHLRRLAKARGTGAPRGSTLTLAYVMWPDMYVVHSGSSRCYLFRDGYLRQLTCDAGGEDSRGRPAARTGTAGAHPSAMVCTEAIMAHPHADVHHVLLHPGDRVLLCTDGLTHRLGNEEMAAHLRAEARVTRACGRLIRAAKRAGDTGNLTLVLARFAC